MLVSHPDDLEVYGPDYPIAAGGITGNVLVRRASLREYGVGFPCVTLGGTNAIIPVISFHAGTLERNEKAARVYYVMRVHRHLPHDAALAAVSAHVPPVDQK